MAGSHRPTAVGAAVALLLALQSLAAALWSVEGGYIGLLIGLIVLGAAMMYSCLHYGTCAASVWFSSRRTDAVQPIEAGSGTPQPGDAGAVSVDATLSAIERPSCMGVRSPAAAGPAVTGRGALPPPLASRSARGEARQLTLGAESRCVAVILISPSPPRPINYFFLFFPLLWQIRSGAGRRQRHRV